MTQLADYFIPALRFDFIRYETARSGGTTNLNAIGNEGLLKLSKRLEAAGRPSIQPHLHRDPDQVRMALRAKLLLEQ
jgi:hypothetical protein